MIGWIEVEPFPKTRPIPSYVSANSSDEQLQVRFYLMGESMVGRAHFGASTQGPPGHAHGGSMAALLDEVMGGTCWALGKPVLAAQITIQFRNKLPLGTVVQFEGRIERSERKKMYTAGVLKSIDGSVVYAEGTGLFIQVGAREIGVKDG